MQFYEGNAAIPLIEEKNFYYLNILHTVSFPFYAPINGFPQRWSDGIPMLS